MPRRKEPVFSKHSRLSEVRLDADGIVLVMPWMAALGVLYPVHDGGVCVAKYIAVGQRHRWPGCVCGYHSRRMYRGFCPAYTLSAEPEELVKPVAVTSRVGREGLSSRSQCSRFVGKLSGDTELSSTTSKKSEHPEAPNTRLMMTAGAAIYL